MKTIKQFKIAGILVMVLGVIHTLASPLIIVEFRSLYINTLLCFAYMFIATGIFTFALGWLQYFVLRKIIDHSSFLILLKATVVLAVISGIGAVATMWTNPFAYLMLLIALYECILLRIVLQKGIDKLIATKK